MLKTCQLQGYMPITFEHPPDEHASNRRRSTIAAVRGFSNIKMSTRSEI